MKRMKTVYVYENMDGIMVSIFFKTRNEALAWEREYKVTFDEPIFLTKREILAKRWKQYFEE